MIRDIVSHVASAVGGTVGLNIFAIWRQPGALDPSVIINERAGIISESGLRSQMVQIIGIGSTPLKARDFSYKIYNAIERKKNILMGSTRVLYVDPIGPPMLLGRNAENDWEFTANFLFQVDNTTFQI